MYEMMNSLRMGTNCTKHIKVNLSKVYMNRLKRCSSDVCDAVSATVQVKVSVREMLPGVSAYPYCSDRSRVRRRKDSALINVPGATDRWSRRTVVGAVYAIYLFIFMVFIYIMIVSYWECLLIGKWHVGCSFFLAFDGGVQVSPR